MAKFTQEDRDYLYQIFENSHHEVREGITTKSGKVRWWVYLNRQAIINHLDDRFFGEWSMDYHSHRDMKSYSEVYCRLSIRGLHRENNGSNTANSDSDEHVGKGAATDAFKRAASSWGIGLYLQDAPQIWTDYDYMDGRKTDYKKRAQREQEALQQVYKWLDSLRGTSFQKPAPAPAPAVEKNEGQQQSTPAKKGKESVTPETKVIVTKMNKKGEPYLVVEGCTFFSREVFRQLDYDVDGLDKAGIHELPDPVQIVYINNEKGFKEALRVQRKSTGKVHVISS